MKKLIINPEEIDIRESIFLNGGYCISSKIKNSTTKCMCDYAKKYHVCKCGLFLTIEVPDEQPK